MASDLLQIGKSGTIAARSALDLTAQNIANANNASYARRSLGLAEVVTPGSMGFYSQSSMAGVRVDSINRSDSWYLFSEARRTGSDAARASAELSGLRDVEAAIEQSGVYPAIVEMEASLSNLEADPLNGAIRATVLESGRSLADSLRIADAALTSAGDKARFEASAGVDQVNKYAAEIARINSAISRVQPGSTSHAALLDQRDAQLAGLSQKVGITTSYAPSGVVQVQLNDVSSPVLVNGSQSTSLAVTNNADGTIAFTLGSAAVTPASGELAGASQALVAQRDFGVQLDNLAAQLIQTVNDAQTNGVALDGTAGQPFFSGTDASDIGIALSSGDGIATAPTGAPANSRDTGNLNALRSALANGGPAAAADKILYEVSSTISNRSITSQTLNAIAGTANAALAAETAVDTDAETVNLIRFQQAFQASGRVIQVASNIFDTILGIR